MGMELEMGTGTGLKMEMGTGMGMVQSRNLPSACSRCCTGTTPMIPCRDAGRGTRPSHTQAATTQRGSSSGQPGALHSHLDACTASTAWKILIVGF